MALTLEKLNRKALIDMIKLLTRIEKCQKERDQKESKCGDGGEEELDYYNTIIWFYQLG